MDFFVLYDGRQEGHKTHKCSLLCELEWVGH